MFPYCVQTMHILPNLVTYTTDDDKASVSFIQTNYIPLSLVGASIKDIGQHIGWINRSISVFSVAFLAQEIVKMSP